MYKNDECSKLKMTKLNSNDNQILNVSKIDKRLKLNDYTILGTHNSYHLENYFYKYSHKSLTKQLLFGIRQIELDIHLMKNNNLIYHLQIFDDKTNCYCFKHCLMKIKEFTSKYKYHYPIYLFIEIKQMFYEDIFTGLTGGVKCQHFQQIKKEILEIFSYQTLILPKQIQGNQKSIKIALKKQKQKQIQGDFIYRNYGWPPISTSLGKLIPVFLDDVHNIVVDLYYQCSSIRNFFFISQKNQNLPYSSIITISNSIKDKQILIDSHQNGFLIRLLLAYGNKNIFQTYQLTKHYGIHIISSDSIQCSRTLLCQSLAKDFKHSTILCNKYSSPHFCNSSISFFQKKIK
ncbi:unnamed protein product [Adineta steineri]|uniref:Uncharacterized protein n=1 Tax=Adineta steineri TaxID=433720 RepID=A0A818VSV1_9BILA|nr:unnamed protein product [Adineta steineri]CAF0871921.1 unnamed protein product [Adineta steineri]CAF1380536.1 unnamed protein product [Adineta steineri]CAF3676519.1 unnamed protein product [Adineta steineri]CAF3691509.1 unnamed protein product [Adineta steineri]